MYVVPLHLGEGIVLAFAQDIGGAVRGGGPAGDHNVQMILIALGRGMLGEHLVKVYRAHGAEPTQNTQNGMFVLHGLVPRPFAQIGRRKTGACNFLIIAPLRP